MLNRESVDLSPSLDRDSPTYYDDDLTHVLLDWKKPFPLAVAAQAICELGLPPSEYIVGSSLEQLLRYLDTAKVMAHNHLKLLSRLNQKNVNLLRERSQFNLSTQYRSSVEGNTEGIGTIELRLDNQPIFHARLMQFAHKKQPYLAVTCLQRFTDEKLSPIATPFFTKTELEQKKRGVAISGIQPLRITNPNRYSEYQKETQLIKNLEKKLGTTIPQMALAVCIALAKSCDNSIVLLSRYQDQFWVKKHRDILDETVIRNIYDSTASFFEMTYCEEFSGFWELNGKKEGLLFSQSSSANSSDAVQIITQSAYQNFCDLLYKVF